MDRQQKVLKHIRKSTPGIEIGPSHNPLAPKSEGYNVHIVDHMTREGLLKKYEGHHVNLERIEEVDFVWSGQSYAELTGRPKHYDWAIASHLIEHTPDLIGFLNNCDGILKDDGVLSLAIPDKRYCFDHFRPITGIGKIIDSHVQKNTIHTAGSAAEFFLNVVSRADQIAWCEGFGGDFKLLHSPAEAQEGMQTILNKKTYLDLHAWCFVPHSFRLIIHDLHSLGLIPFQEVDFFPSVGCEFFVTLGRSGRGSGLSRFEMLEAMEEELHSVAQAPAEVPPPAIPANSANSALRRPWRWLKSVVRKAA